MEKNKREIGVERMFLRGPNVNVVMVVNLIGNISEQWLEKAILKVRRKHFLLGVRVILGDDKNAWFTSRNVPRIPISILKKTSDDQWKTEVIKELKTRFSIEEGPLIRVKLLKSPKISTLIITAHHSICDGMSLIMLIRDFLTFLETPEKNVEEMQIPPLITDDNLPSSATAGIFTKFIFKILNKKWKKKKISFNKDNSIELHQHFWNKYDCSLTVLSLSEAQTSSLIGKCKEKEITVNSAIVTALTAAQKKIQGKSKPFFQKIICAVNLKKRLLKPIDEDIFGYYAAGIDLEVDFSMNKSFWENAQKIQEEVNRKNIEKKIFASQKVKFLNQSLIDAFIFAKEGHLDDKMVLKIVNKTGRGKLNAGFTITNLGKLNIPEKYGNLQIESIIGPIVFSDGAEKVVGVTTIVGKLIMVFIHAINFLDTDTMEKIKKEVLNYLEDAIII